MYGEREWLMLNPPTSLTDSGLAGPITGWVSQNNPHWADTRIEAWDDNRLQNLMLFVRSHYWSDRHSVNVFSVVGTAHPDYIGLSWGEFLQQGKRMQANQHLLQTNPQYYFKTGVKQPSMLYVSLNGKHWYVNGDGNHRTCLARFHFERLNAAGFDPQTMVHGVTVDDYRVDWKLFDVFTKLRAALDCAGAGRVEGYRYHIGREDGPAWKIDRYEPTIRYTDAKGNEQILKQEAAQDLLFELTRKSAWHLGWWK
jgi:hypothetical protein